MAKTPVVLNVDDHEVVRYSRTRILTSAGFTVHEAGTGAETMAVAAAHRPDIVLLDVHLPDANGVELCRRLKAQAQGESLIVLQITASALAPANAIASLEGGADAYLTEPVNPDVLVATVKALLRLHHAERSLTHANRQLEIVNHELQRSNEDLQQFAFAASHDLQEPLREISIFVEILKHEFDGRLSEDEQVHFGHVVRAADRMRILIRDLLAYSQVGRGQKPKEIVDLQAVADWAVLNLRESISDAGATLTFSQKLPQVLGDFAQLGQVFQNLLSNAIKYRQPSEPLRVHIDFEQVSGEQWLIRVADNGSGISEEYHDKIFVPFKRLHGAEIPGAGIGLALCRRIIETHGGRIWVESSLGQGATFSFTLQSA